MVTRPTPITCLVLLAVAAAVVVGGCSDEASDGGGEAGDSLRFGEPYEDEDVTVTPVEIVRGDIEDLAAMDLDAEERSSVPHYLHMRFENTGPRSDPGSLTSGLRLLGDRGEQLTPLVLIGDFPLCESVDPPDPWDTGAVHETCQIFLAPPDSAPAALRHEMARGVSWEIAADDLDREEPPAGEPGGDPLPFGEPSELGDDAGDAGGLVVTPVEVVTGAIGDLASFDLPAEDRAATPYYVHMRFQHPDRTVREVELSSVTFQLSLLDDAGQPLQPLTLLARTGSFPPCETPSRAADGAEQGGPYETCEIFLAPPGAQPATLEFATQASVPVRWAI